MLWQWHRHIASATYFIIALGLGVYSMPIPNIHLGSRNIRGLMWKAWGLGRGKPQPSGEQPGRRLRTPVELFQGEGASDCLQRSSPSYGQQQMLDSALSRTDVLGSAVVPGQLWQGWRIQLLQTMGSAGCGGWIQLTMRNRRQELWGHQRGEPWGGPKRNSGPRSN